MGSLRLGLISISLATIAGCGPEKSSEGEGGNSGDTGSESGSTTGSTPGASSSVGSATGGSGTGHSGASTGGDDDCPPPTGVRAGFSLAGVDEWADVGIDIVCTLSAITQPAEGADELTLTDCVDGAGEPAEDAVLVISTEPYSPPLVEEGADLHLRYVSEPPFYAGKWFTLRSEPGDMLLAAGIAGPRLHPLAGDLHYAPLEIDVQEEGCERTPDPTGCGDGERVALEVRYDGTSALVFDDTSGIVGQLTSYSLVVQRAVLWRDIVCDDFPDAAFGAVFMLLMEG